MPKHNKPKTPRSMHLRILLAVLLAISSFKTAISQNSDCETSCGNVSIVYPFGVREGCYYNSDFFVNCNRSTGEPILFLRRSRSITITNISVTTGEIETMGRVAYDCYNTSGAERSFEPTLTLRNFQISTRNRFVVIGCDTHAYIRGDIGNVTVRIGCISRCDSNSGITNGSCSGIGCCEIAIPEGMSETTVFLSSYDNHTGILDFNPCSYAIVVEEGEYNFSSTDLLDFGRRERMPRILDWAIGNTTCETARLETDKFLCNGNSECDPSYVGEGYRCRCLEGYHGNPYLPNDCNNINECQDGIHDCEAESECNDTPGNYTCTCPNGYTGDGKKSGTSCTYVATNDSRIIEITVCTSAGVIILLISATWLYLGLKKRKLMILREKFFKQNGGIMLQQRISGDTSSPDQAKVFTIEELKKATNNYDESRIIGKGGFGTVYKGVLSDKRVVAIKKSKLADQTESQIEQFINEVVILSQINHRNVVKLIGCCLENEIPLLVYEFISNGTLSDHIHALPNSSAMTWDIRLRIATETAGALSYLHSSASVPIIHRDVKPANILLDDSFVAKVADFGASRLIPMDQIELATIVQGTLGYLDPEYMHTSQLTDKSDVYSFGVVLVELLTGKMALSFDRPEKERNLGMYFLSSLKEGRLLYVLDERLELNEVPDEIIDVSKVAERCLRLEGEKRPTMKEVALELERISASMIQKHPWVQSTSNEEEAEYLLRDPMEGYGYVDLANTSSTTFDSMSNNSILPIASAR